MMEEERDCEKCIHFIHGVDENEVDGVDVLNCKKHGLSFGVCNDFDDGYTSLHMPRFVKEWMDDWDEEEKEKSPTAPDRLVYTHGRFTPCPFCGSSRVKIFCDGTARCVICKEWWRYQ